MAFTNIWDDTQPPDTQAANLLGQDLRNFRLDTQQRMAAISGLDAGKPNFAGDTQPASWNGILYFATDTGKIYQFNNPAWTDVTADFVGGVPISFETTNLVTGISIPANLLQATSVIDVTASALISGGLGGSGTIETEFGGFGIGTEYTFGHGNHGYFSKSTVQMLTNGSGGQFNSGGFTQNDAGGDVFTTAHIGANIDTTAAILVNCAITTAAGASVSGVLKTVIYI